MATNISPCNLSQLAAANLYGNLYAQANTPKAGTFDALTSPINTAGFEAVQADINSRNLAPNGETKRIVQVRSINPDCDDTYTEVGECDITSDAVAFNYENVEVTEVEGFSFKFTETQFAEICSGRTELLEEAIQAKYKGFLRRMDIALINKVAPLMGTINGVDTVTNPIVLPFINGSGTPNAGAFAQAIATYMQLGYTDLPLMVGGISFAQIKAIQSLLATNTAIGINLDALDLSRIYYDNALDAEIANGLQNVLSWMPGTFQLVSYYDNLNRRLREPMSLEINFVNVSGVKKELGIVNINGIDFDFYYEYNCGIHNFAYQKRFDIFAAPSGAFCEDKFPAIGWANVCGDLSCPES